MVEVRCPNCGTSFQIGKGGAPVSELSDGIHFLVPDTVRNNNVTKVNARMEALKTAGVDVDKLQSLMSTNEEFKTIFEADDPILDTISKGGFIRNPELFRRWICAQTFRLLKDPRGWTHAVRSYYNTRYVFHQTREELWLQIKLQNKGITNDKRFTFFTLENFKSIFIELENSKKSAAVIEGKTVKVVAKAGSNGKLFGSVTTKDISEAISKQFSIQVDRHKISAEDIKNCGTYPAQIKFPQGITADIFVLVTEQ